MNLSTVEKKTASILRATKVEGTGDRKTLLGGRRDKNETGEEGQRYQSFNGRPVINKEGTREGRLRRKRGKGI